MLQLTSCCVEQEAGPDLRQLWKASVTAGDPAKAIRCGCHAEVSKLLEEVLCPHYLSNNATLPAGVKYNEATEKWELLLVRTY